MDLVSPSLFFFSSLGVFNGFLLSLYFLWLARGKHIQHLYFGLLLFMLSLRIGKSVLFFFDRDLSKHILQLGLSACIFVGPLLFLYIRSVLQQQEKMGKEQRNILVGWLALIMGVGLLFPYARRPELWNPEIVQGIYAVWLGYVVAAGYQVRNLMTTLLGRPASLSVVQKWLLVVYFTNVLIALVYNSMLYFGFPSYIFGPITFSLVFYFLAAFLFLYPNSRQIIEGEKVRYGKRKIVREVAIRLRRDLRKVMLEHRLFVDPSLKLKKVADELQVSPHLLSQFLNDNLGQSFSDFVNEHRIDAAADLLQTNNNLTIEGVGAEVGFRSKSSFYAAFKKKYAMTPNQFLRQVKAQKSV